MKPPILKYRRLLVVIGVLGALLAAAASFTNARVERNRAWEAFEQQLLTETRLLAEHAGLSITAAEQMLRVIGSETVNRPVHDLAGDQWFWQRLKQAHGHAPQIASLLIADAEGKVVLTTAQFPTPQDLRIDDRSHFQAARAGDAPYIGTPISSRDSDKQVIPVSVRLDRPDGAFAGTAVALLDVAYFSDFYKAISSAESRWVSLLLKSGASLVSYPMIPGPGNERLAEELLEPLTLSTAGLHRIRSQITGKEAALGYRQVEGYPVIAAVGVTQDHLLGLTQPIWTRNTVILIIFVLGMITALITLDRAFQLVRAAQMQLAQHNRELTALTLTDALTGIANRRAFEQALEREWRRAQRKQRPIGLLFVDADHFKRFNDSYGHTAGDAALRRLASTLDDVVARAGDVVARFGGEELVVLLPDTDLYGTLQVAERIHEALEQERIPFPDSPGEQRVTVSIGGSVALPDDSLCPQDFLDTADAALYAAKAQGRNQTAFLPYPSADDPAAPVRRRVAR